MNSTPDQKPDKKPYRAPSLVRYGDLSRVTNSVGKTGVRDNGKGASMNKTR